MNNLLSLLAPVSGNWRRLLLPLLVLAVPCARAQQAYFQQEVNYRIAVTLDDVQHMLRGNVEMEYHNRSAQSLDTLFIHLWPNAYKNRHTALARAMARSGAYAMFNASDADRGFIDSLDFRANGSKLTWMFYGNHADVAWIKLPQPLKPGEKMVIATPFRVKIPSGEISRLGHIGQSYQITQWYPKPAVFDRNGWHPIPYLNQGEFYSEFGSFDVSITLPENYTVGATGDLQTASETERLDRMSRDNDPEDYNESPPSSSTFKTLRYVQRDVHDFGWFADKRFLVEKSEVTLPVSGRKVTTWAMFTPKNAAVWKNNGVGAINHALLTYSAWVGEYPYNHCTAVDGTISAGGGMEYPNVTVIGTTGDVTTLELIIIHEVGHNWFYGILGSDERDHAWMDEGINSYYETRSIMALRPALKTPVAQGLERLLGAQDFSYLYTDEVSYLISARNFSDQPIEATSEVFTNTNYGTIVYKKTATAFRYLHEYLGEPTFDRCMHTYFDRWKFRHPQPEDLRAVFEEVSGKNLGWFFDELITTTGLLDYRIAGGRWKKTGDGDEFSLHITNRGDLNSPFSLTTIRDADTVNTTWFDPIPSLSAQHIALPWLKRGDRVIVNASQGIPEFERKNNIMRTGTWPQRQWPMRVRLISGIDHPESRQLFVIPLVGWNEYNRWMPGVCLHNRSIPLPRFTWSIAPMYSFSTASITGFASTEWKSRTWSAGIRHQRFGAPGVGTAALTDAPGAYALTSPYIHFNLFPHRVARNIVGSAGITAFAVNRFRDDETPVRFNSTDLLILRAHSEIQWKFVRASLRWKSMIEYLSDRERFNTSHSLEHRYTWHTKTRSRLVSRLFVAGGNRLSIGGANGPLDYAYESLYFGRGETSGLLSRQVVNSQGGLMYPTALRPNGAFATLNVQFDAPVRFPVALYAGLAVMREQPVTAFTVSTEDDMPLQDASAVSWVGGITLPIARDVFQVYLPLVRSSNFKNEHAVEPLKFGETILFELRLDMLNPFTLIRNLNS